MDKINVTEWEEYQDWAEGKSQSTRYHYKASLQKFCNYHNKNPRELVLEAKDHEPENEETVHLEENIADQRLVEWHNHLVENKNVSENSAQTYWRHIKAFYKKWEVEIKEPTPKAPTRTNHQPTYTAYDVRKIKNSARNNRDKAIISVAFQSGMDPQEICRLDYEQVKEAIEQDKDHHFIWKTRKKSKVSHHTPLLKDSIEALQLYIAERKNIEDKINDDDPLFVKKDNRERITSRNIRDIMRNIYERVGEEITKAKNIESQSEYNPFSLKYLRKAFSNACDEAGIPQTIKDYWLGHSRDNYNGAYSGQIGKEKQEEMLKKVKSYLTISTTQKERKEEREEAKRERLQLQKELGKKAEQIQELEEIVENRDKALKVMFRDFRTNRRNAIARYLAEVIKKVREVEGPEEDIIQKTIDYLTKIFERMENKGWINEEIKEKRIRTVENLLEKMPEKVTKKSLEILGEMENPKEALENLLKGEKPEELEDKFEEEGTPESFESKTYFADFDMAELNEFRKDMKLLKKYVKGEPPFHSADTVF